jgi:hypothetical protein
MNNDVVGTVSDIPLERREEFLKKLEKKAKHSPVFNRLGITGKIAPERANSVINACMLDFFDHIYSILKHS